MRIGKIDFEIGKRTYIMGILNVTPDSFSDGGKFFEKNNALIQAEKMISEGADILDIGGESTRPGHKIITEDEEISRVIPVIKDIKKQFPLVPLSIDTYKPEVCKAALNAGADLINDIWGFKYNKKMSLLAKEFDLPVCLMHNRSDTDYKDFLPEFIEDLRESVSIALKSGIDEDKIILDPGIGFGKTYEQNLCILNNLDIIKQHFPYPVLLATSRKSVIGKTLGNISADKRLNGTLATTAVGIVKSCDFIRVHDVSENKEVCRMVDAIVRSKEKIWTKS